MVRRPCSIWEAMCFLGFSFILIIQPVHAAEIRVIYPEMEPTFGGKEVDWIYGDYLMENDLVSLVIGAPIQTRDANLTVRQIGAAIIDLSLKNPSNDQLSAFFPTGGRYLFQDPTKVQTGKDDKGVYWICESSATVRGDGSKARVTYRLSDGDPFVRVTVDVYGKVPDGFEAYDGIRADRTFKFASQDDLAFASDEFFRQAIGFQVPGVDAAPKWKSGRLALLQYDKSMTQSSDNATSWTVHVYPGTCPLDLRGAVSGAAMRQFIVALENRPQKDGCQISRAELTLTNSEGVRGILRTDDAGTAYARLEEGSWKVVATALGFPAAEQEFALGEDSETLTVSMSNGSGFTASAIDQNGDAIPVKATIYSKGGPAPDYGPDSTRTFVKNCVYAVHGSLLANLEPGQYEIYFSHGPEYDAVVREIEVGENEYVDVQVTLPRVVDTTGWVSTELHSHSSPSGDNVSDQFGRVENLLCENLEFAPCTEHARVSSYVPHLKAMRLEHLMATCSGMELTGQPLPMNHQNAFPLHHHPHTQNGGGPRTDANPVVQIERLAMWDNGSAKVVQQNHPNLHQIFGDVDTDGIPDSGFKGMFQWMDVVEVHPLQTIFQDVAANPPATRDMRIPIFQWMQLLNQGIRVPGVVNTDAHYNYHGSGWLRNWFASSTDDPAEISIDEMIHEAEHGHIIMSTGPFLSVRAASTGQDRIAIPGDDLRLGSNGKVQLKVTVQCPNWLDVNRVQVFVNGRPLPELNHTRRTHASLFGPATDVVKFDATIDVDLKSDAHIIVATIGEGRNMQKVMGEQYGNIPPIAVSNPIFVDAGDDGFTPNGDELGIPLPRQNR